MDILSLILDKIVAVAGPIAVIEALVIYRLYSDLQKQIEGRRDDLLDSNKNLTSLVERIQTTLETLIASLRK